MDNLASGQSWGRYDNNYWRPNYKLVESDLPWLLDNWKQLCEALAVLRDDATSKKVLDSNKKDC